MLTIDRLRLNLPGAFGNRAEEIARMVAEELATLPLAADLDIDRLKVPPVHVAPSATSREVARAIAASVGAGMRERVR